MLARDHVGVKPLYYAVHDGTLVFGSEVKVLLASGLVPRELDVDALGQFLAWEYVPGDATLLRHVRKLRAAEMLELDLATGCQHAEPLLGRSGAGRRCHRELTRGLGGRGRRDGAGVRPAAACERRPARRLPVGWCRQFARGRRHGRRRQDLQHWIRRSDLQRDARGPSASPASLGVSHRVEIIRPQVVELFHRLMHFMDDPIGDFSIFPTYLVSQLAREDVKVAFPVTAATSCSAVMRRTWQMRRPIAGREYRPWHAALSSRQFAPCRPTAAKKGLVNKAKRFVEGFDHEESLGHARWRVFAGEAVRRDLFTAAGARGDAHTGRRAHCGVAPRGSADAIGATGHSTSIFVAISSTTVW